MRSRSLPTSVRAILVIGAAAAIATLGLMDQGGQLSEAVADHPLDEHFDPMMPQYPRVSEFPLGEKLSVGEGQMKMSYFGTKDPPLRVARFYRTLWEQQGLSVHHSVSPMGGVVGTYDPRINAARSVTIMAKNGMTWAFPATIESPSSAMRSGDLGTEDGLPVFPDSSKGLTLRTTDNGKASTVTTYSNDGGLAKNLRFYQEEMEARGWQPMASEDFEELEGHKALEFSRGPDRCTFNLTPVGERDHVIISVVYEGEDG